MEPFYDVALPAVGDAVLVAVSLSLAAAEIYLFRQRRESKHLWTTVILVGVAGFAGFMGVHYHVQDDHAALMTRLEASAVAVIVHAWVMLVSARSTRPVPIRPALLAMSFLLYALLIWLPQSLTAVQHHTILLLDHPLPRRVDDAFQTVSLAYGLFLAILGVLWLRRWGRSSTWPGRGMSVLAGCALVDSVTAGLSIPVPLLLLEYGLLTFAISLVAEGMREYVTLLRSQRRDFRQLIQQTPDLIAMVRDGRIVDGNPSLLRALDVPKIDAIVGRDAMHVLGLHAKPVLSESITGTVQRPDGRNVHLELHALEMDFDLEPALVLVGRDVTERHELTAQAMVLDRAVTVGTVAAGVGHEINNPLAYVTTTLEEISESIAERWDPELVRSRIRTALTGLTRIGRIVEGLGTFSSERRVEPTDVAEVVQSAVTIAASEVGRAATLVVDLEEDLPLVEADFTRLGQALINLLTNAAQAIGTEAPNDHEIRLAVFRDGEHVLFEVRDTGPGIPEDVLPRVFDLFFTTKASQRGTGLGLAISHESLRSMGGSLEATNRTDRSGAIFRGTLRASQRAVDTREASPEPRPLPTRAHVLLVDDEPQLLKSMTRILQSEVDVVTANDGVDAIAKLKADPAIDMIVTDLLMPQMTGMELHAWALAHHPVLAKSMLFVTGGAFTPDARDFVARFPDRILRKPMKIAELRDRIQTTLARLEDAQ